MASVVEWVLFAGVLAAHTVVAAVTVRFFRVNMKTQWGWIVYSVLVTPFVLFVTTLVTAGVLGIGPDLGRPVLALAVPIGVPFALGFTIDLLYVPPPEEYELPDTRDG